MANLHPRKSLAVPGSLGQPKAAVFSFNKFLRDFPWQMTRWLVKPWSLEGEYKHSFSSEQIFHRRLFLQQSSLASQWTIPPTKPCLRNFRKQKKTVLWKLPPYSSEPKQILTSIFFKSTFALLKPTTLAIFAKDFEATCYTSLGMKRDVSTYRICILVYTGKKRKYVQA